jgi:hypothetical protein
MRRKPIFEEIKDMTPAEEAAYLEARVEPIHKQFGIRTVSEAESAELRKRVSVITV